MERKSSIESLPDLSASGSGNGLIFEVAVADDYSLLDSADTTRQAPTGFGQPVVDDSEDMELRALRIAALQSHKESHDTTQSAVSVRMTHST